MNQLGECSQLGLTDDYTCSCPVLFTGRICENFLEKFYTNEPYFPTSEAIENAASINDSNDQIDQPLSLGNQDDVINSFDEIVNENNVTINENIIDNIDEASLSPIITESVENTVTSIDFINNLDSNIKEFNTTIDDVNLTNINNFNNNNEALTQSSDEKISRIFQFQINISIFL